MASRQFAVLILVYVFMGAFAEKRDIYLAMMEGDPIVSSSSNSLKSRLQAKSTMDYHNQLLESTLQAGSYAKLFSFKHVANGFTVHVTRSQAEKLKRAARLRHLEKDRGARLMTTYMPEFLGLSPLDRGTMLQGGSRDSSEGIVIGFVDSGIDQLQPSFANNYPLFPPDNRIIMI